eukprot:TRINITY_DN75181_c0_g1_i1.p1 TRINITY_DN75181_c0_g1~~TRINITY_DN75181_c0_g1_i1.p1  ORF type:complete len:372 (+),score=55.54 TRINITY_DN75181_c0_g1_i1:73-1188(+)
MEGMASGEEASASVDEPERLLCPITHIMYKDPVVVAGSGNTYEREAVLAHWHSRGSAQDPLSNVSVKSHMLITNWDKRREVSSFLAAHTGHVPEGWTDRVVPPPQDSLQWASKTWFAHPGETWLAFFDNLPRMWLVDELVDLLPRHGHSATLLFVALLGVLLAAFAALVGSADPGAVPVLPPAFASSVVSLMEIAPGTAWLQGRGCVALASIAASGSDGQAAVMQAGGVRTLVDVLQQHPQVAWLQGRACEALATLALRNANNRLSIAHAGGTQLVLRALTKHFWDARVLAQAAAALANVAFDAGEVREVALRAGAVDSLVEALRAPHADAFVHESACLALRSLARGGAHNRATVEHALASAGVGCPSPIA